MNKGTVKWFNNQKGYGFISDEAGNDVFVHYSGLVMEGFKTLEEGAAVEFEVINGEKGPHHAQRKLVCYPFCFGYAVFYRAQCGGNFLHNVPAGAVLVCGVYLAVGHDAAVSFLLRPCDFQRFLHRQPVCYGSHLCHFEQCIRDRLLVLEYGVSADDVWRGV